ncbi:hypothetical protein BA950_10525 [Erythrobacter sp. SAORIC-644]|jgi:hypothetical protein|uniref:Uncharacterized protein n=1 Tax=Qipengyuania pacifica TaxID=2860199 RepID=A0ABS7JDG7_9SPHN|nr:MULTISPECIES: hypothetical protein [Erythrobacteraceae]MBG75103.1 hypothetical protein [Erythrobacteraceae bacterium]MCH2496973.1 hypothetical protein [Erythrobacter sp.]QPL39937.1 hypothetical protein IT881_01310 [Erythrobacter sp. A30-3]MBX7487071.1 hypothetical protein [Qipengyuania aerophila]PNQ76218.1 hypothetical protein BA950_10525 [Erythrobacter sp. SAORIC-644]|tara:strand:- start:23894 stop:24304 length:411 start_codon:yes stop_codon:yes gene_type:complete
MFKHIALATAAFGMLSSPVLADENAQMTRGEEKLAKLLDGRVAGEPQSCIRTLGSRNLSQIDGTALTYRDGDTVWVNYTRNPDSIDDRDIMVIDRFSGSSLCRTDQVKLVDRVNGFLSGILLLDEFVPYKKVDTEG